MKRLLFAGFLSLLVGALATTRLAAAEIPSPPREFRAAWIATVANIDWPSRKGLSSDEQRRELVALLDQAVELNLNAVILQIRPSADAFYASRIEPWSEYLTGVMGRPPKPYYDPLKFAVEEAHKRGLQLHVWLNPYRVRHADAKTEASPVHVSRSFPEIVREYGSYLWFDPGEPESLQRFLDVVTDVVKRYDVDGVHIDDYFYPYPVNDEHGKPIPFPDDESYALAKAAAADSHGGGHREGHGGGHGDEHGGGHGEESHGETEHASSENHGSAEGYGEAETHDAAEPHDQPHGDQPHGDEHAADDAHGQDDSHDEHDAHDGDDAHAAGHADADDDSQAKNDWRRENCNRLVEEMYKAVKKEKPWVLIGVSPFGIWRPGHPEGIQGLDQYETLYSDARKWLNEGWVDYFTPQLYWQIEGPQSYPKLLAWWHGENKKNRHLWPGNGAHNVRRSADVPPGRSAWPAEELIEQIELTRKEVNQPGNVHFSMKCLVDNRDGLADKLKSGVYKEQALIPESPWLGEETPAKPTIAAKRAPQGVAVEMKSGDGKQPWLWVVRARQGDAWTTKIVPGHESRMLLAETDGAQPEEVVVSAVARLGREGEVAATDVE